MATTDSAAWPAASPSGLAWVPTWATPMLPAKCTPGRWRSCLAPLVASSGLYHRAPVQAEGPDFLNAVKAELRTTLAPLALLQMPAGAGANRRRETPLRQRTAARSADVLLGALAATAILALPA